MYSKMRGPEGNRIMPGLTPRARPPHQKLLDPTAWKGVQCAARLASGQDALVRGL